MVSLVLSAALTAFADFLKTILPAAALVIRTIDFLVSGTLIIGIFAVMYKILPDRFVRWRDALPGAVFATILFEGGKYLIALYIGQTNVASSFGGAGAIIILLLWIFYSAQIFLLDAEFSRIRALGVPKDVGADRGDMPLVRPSTNG